MLQRLRLILIILYGGLIIAAAASPLLGGPRSYAPLALVPSPPARAIEIVAASELAAWIKPAAEQFNAQRQVVAGRTIVVNVRT